MSQIVTFGVAFPNPKWKRYLHSSFGYETYEKKHNFTIMRSLYAVSAKNRYTCIFFLYEYCLGLDNIIFLDDKLSASLFPLLRCCREKQGPIMVELYTKRNSLSISRFVRRPSMLGSVLLADTTLCWVMPLYCALLNSNISIEGATWLWNKMGILLIYAFVDLWSLVDSQMNSGEPPKGNEGRLGLSSLRCS
jgi:hypothetical protein